MKLVPIPERALRAIKHERLSVYLDNVSPQTGISVGVSSLLLDFFSVVRKPGLGAH